MYWILLIPFAACLVVSLRYGKLVRRREPANYDVGKEFGLIYLMLFLLLAAAFLTFNLLTFMYLFVLSITLPVCARVFRMPAWLFVPILCLVTVSEYAKPVMKARQLQLTVQNYQQQYPLESIADRLAYEQANAPLIKQYEQSDGETDATEAPIPLLEEGNVSPLKAPRPGDDLLLLQIAYGDSFDQMHYRAPQDRRDALEIVHGGWKRRFSQLMGQGVFRMRWMRDWENHLEEGTPEDLYLPDEYTPADQFDSDIFAANELSDELLGRDVTRRPDAEAHLRAVVDFVNPSGWGYVKSRDEVAGFQSHRFRSRPVVLDPKTLELDEWRITQLELVSLLKHDTPRVYIEESLPNMEHFSGDDVPTRELDEFEKRSLQFVRKGRDIVIDEQPHHIRMFGSLRAVEDCQQCHDVPQHTLLGAFTYELKKPAASVSLK